MKKKTFYQKTLSVMIETDKIFGNTYMKLAVFNAIQKSSLYLYNAR